MEGRNKSIQLVVADLSMTVSWGREVSEETALESVNKLCLQFVNLYGGSYARFVDGDGIELSLETVVVTAASPVFLRIPDAEHQPAVEFEPTRDLTRLDPRSDGNLSFGGRNWLYNNISLDGSYYNNPFGLDAPEPDRGLCPGV